LGGAGGTGTIACMSVWSEDDDRLSRLIADDDWQAVEIFI
jgi:hypothetical protein